MLDIQVEEYRASTGESDARRSNLFSRTNGFEFSDSANGFLRTSSATTDMLGIRIGRVHSTGHEIDLTELYHSTVLLPQQGSLEARNQRAENSCDHGGALLFGPNRRTTRAVASSDEPFEANVLMFPTDVLKSSLDKQVLDNTGNILETGVAVDEADPLSGPFLKYCDFLVSAVFSDSAALSNPRHLRGTEALLIELYGELITRLAEKNDSLPVLSAGTRYVVKAEEYMRANLDEPVTVAEIAAATGISARSLQLAFREVRSAAPREILAMMRLNLVHEKLKSDKSEAGVTQIALECGVANIGRFARSYHEVYGEKPSTTRRRARAKFTGRR